MCTGTKEELQCRIKLRATLFPLKLRKRQRKRNSTISSTETPAHAIKPHLEPSNQRSTSTKYKETPWPMWNYSVSRNRGSNLTG